MAIQADQVLDTSGTVCPVPVLRTLRLLKTMEVGQVLKVIVTDRGAAADISEWNEMPDRQIVGQEREGEKYLFYIRKTG